jgi:hypothetical protein
MSNAQIFYVYEHWRLDRDECFYVGKGKKNRAYSRGGRSSHWGNIVAKLERIGSSYEVRLVATDLKESEAFSLEKERILFWRDKVDLCNKTDGGDGVSGLVMSEGSRQKMSAKAKGRPGNITMLGRKHSDETRAKMSAAHKGKSKSAEHAAKVGAAHKGKKRSEEYKKKLSVAHMGKIISLETRAKLSESAKLQWSDPLRRPDKSRKIGV